MAKLGFRTVDEMVGRVDKIDAAVADTHWKAKGIDLSSILYSPTLPSRVARRCMQAQDHGLDAGARSRAHRQGRSRRSNREDAGHWQLRNPQRASHRRRDAGRRDRAPLRLGWLARRNHSLQIRRARPGRASALSFPPASRSNSKAMPTTTSARGSPAGASSLIRPRHRASCRKKASSSATLFFTAQPAAKYSSTASPASASRCATPAQLRWLKAWAITAANT